MGEIGKIVRATHERWDGGGYVDGLAATEIPLGARIIAVCDAYTAMTSDRPYRPAMTPEAAVEELRRCAGSQFDPGVVEAFCRVHAEASIGTAPAEACIGTVPAGQREDGLAAASAPSPAAPATAPTLAGGTSAPAGLPA